VPLTVKQQLINSKFKESEIDEAYARFNDWNIVKKFLTEGRRNSKLAQKPIGLITMSTKSYAVIKAEREEASKKRAKEEEEQKNEEPNHKDLILKVFTDLAEEKKARESVFENRLSKDEIL
jgi:hypothetical protein